MLTLFHKKRTAASSASKPSSSSIRPGLKPLHLVEKLVAANVIAPQAPPPPPRLNLLGRNKKARSSVPLSRPSTVKGPRSSLPVKEARAPFVVPLRFPSRDAPRASITSRPSIPDPTPSCRPIRASKAAPTPKAVIPIGRARTSVVLRQNPKVAVNSGKGKAAVTTASKPRVPSTHSPKPATVKRPQIKRPKVVTLTSPKQPSRIPVFVGRPSAGLFTPSPTPRSSSRIPRLKYAYSPSSPSSTSSGSVISFDLATPCPSPALAVAARQMAPKIVVFKTVEVQVTIEDVNFETVELIVDACTKLDGAEVKVVEIEPEDVDDGQVSLHQETPRNNTMDLESNSTDVARLSSSGNAESVCLEAPAPAEFRAPEETDKTQEPGTGEEDGGIMGQLISELKTRLSWGKNKNSNSPYTIDRLGRRRPTSTGTNENTAPETTSELQQAFARRQSATTSGTWKFDFMKKKQPENQNQNTNTKTRKLLAPVPQLNPNIVNGSIHDVLPQTSTPTLVIPAPNSSSSLDDPHPESTPPGAEEDFVVTELVSTAFGTRRIRRVVIPPMLEGAQPSRDPKIIKELTSLRAQQKVVAAVEKVGGGAEKIINVGGGCDSRA